MIPALLRKHLVAAAIVCIAAATPLLAQRQPLVDMAGRKVLVAPVHRVWAAYPPVNYMVYALDPSLLIGWVGPIPEENRRFFAKPSLDLPVVGGWFGQRTPNLEILAKLKPDLALVWDQSLATTPTMVEKLDSIGIPVAAVRIYKLSDYPDAMRFLGVALNRRKRAEALAAYLEKSIAEMKAFSAGIPEKERVRVFFALGPEGLKNDCDHMPFFAESAELAGGRMAHECAQSDRVGQMIDIERLLLYNPDVLIAQDDLFLSKVYTDPRYAGLKAVRERRVYQIPKRPFNWLCYPPSFMRAVGVRWLAWRLYPQRYPAARLEAETQRFFQLFFGARLSASDVRALVN